MSSKYAAIVPLIVRDIHHLLIAELALPTSFKSADPELGQAYGLLSTQNISELDKDTMKLDCTFLASAAFDEYWESATWAIATGMNLDSLLSQIAQKVNRRGIFSEFDKTSSITIGQPRSPIKAVGNQKPTIWVVDVVLPCEIKLLISRDIVCGHI